MSNEPPEPIRSLADKFGIADPVELSDSLYEAYSAAEDANAEQLGVYYHSPKDIAQRERIEQLVGALRHEFRPTHITPWSGSAAHFIREELDRYAAWLATQPVRVQPTRPKARPVGESSRAFVTTLAASWPALTGTQPKVWQDNITGAPGGRFYEFLIALWPDHWPDAGILPWSKFPSPATVKRWLKVHKSDSMD